jgi:carbon starvation protein CstA
MKPVGYGAMLAEGFVALIAMVTIMIFILVITLWFDHVDNKEHRERCSGRASSAENSQRLQRRNHAVRA